MNKNYRDLLVWQKAMDLVVLVYQHSRRFPKHETFGLASQMQRAVVSIPSNLAEGNERGSQKEFLRFLFIASGSVAELETQLEIALRLDYLAPDVHSELLRKTDEIGKMLGGLRKNLQAKIAANNA